MKANRTHHFLNIKHTLLLLLICQSVLFAQKKERILFIGNSFTYYWNFPKVVEEMAVSRSLKWDVYQATLPAAKLEQHWKGERKLTTKKLVSKKKFSKIILQDQSATH